jgi:hypothetical protein
MICRCVSESRLPGWVVVRQADGHTDYARCPDCGGSLVASCCDMAGSAAPLAPPVVARIREALARPPVPPDADELDEREVEEF